MVYSWLCIKKNERSSILTSFSSCSMNRIQYSLNVQSEVFPLSIWHDSYQLIRHFGLDTKWVICGLDAIEMREVNLHGTGFVCHSGKSKYLLYRTGRNYFVTILAQAENYNLLASLGTTLRYNIYATHVSASTCITQLIKCNVCNKPITSIIIILVVYRRMLVGSLQHCFTFSWISILML